MTPDWASIGVMVAVGVFLWRALGARVDALGARVDALAADVREIDRRLTLAVADVDRRLARLEGWIEGERAGRARPLDAPADGGAS